MITTLIEHIVRGGLTTDFIAVASCVAVTVFFYGFAERVNRTVSLFAMFFSVVGCAIQILGGAFHAAGLVVGHYVTALNIEPFRALSGILMNLSRQGFQIGLGFFGVYCLFMAVVIGANAYRAGATYDR